MSALDVLSTITARVPCRVIPNENGPYLTRYTLSELPDGHVYLHHFHASDASHELHNHPWPGSSLILVGGYREERLSPDGNIVSLRAFLPGDVNFISADTFHRVDLLDEVAGCWTLFVTGAYCQSWGFLDRVTRVFTPWRDALRARGLLPAEVAS